jgi:phage baseplate assembly protein W
MADDGRLFRDTTKTYSDLNIGFIKNPITKDIPKVTNEKAVTQAISNLVQTRFGEKLMDPDTGSKVYEMLFEPLDVFSAIELKDRVINTIKNFEPRVEVVEVQVSILEDEDSVLVELLYRIIGEPEIVSTQFLLQRSQ